MELTLDKYALAIQAVLFLALMAFLTRSLFRPMLRVFEERERRVEGNRKEAETLLGQARTASETYEARLVAARGEANDLRLKIRKEAADKQTAILAEASAKAADALRVMKERIDGESAQARAALRSDAERMARDLAGKLLGRSV